MSEKDFDFDRQMIDHLGQIPPPDEEVSAANPWSRPIESVTWGLILTTIRLEFLYLQYLLPTIGVILIYLGFRSLRQENRYFKAAWILSIVKLVLQLGTLVQESSPYTFADNTTTVAALVLLAFQIALFLFFRQALKLVYQKANKPQESDPLLWASVWTAAALLIALSPFSHSWLLFIPMIIFYILIVRTLADIGEELDDTGYVMTNAPVKISGKVFGRTYFLIALCTVVGCCIFYNHLPLTQQVYQPPQITQERQHLLDMDFPKEALQYLSDDDVSSMREAKNIESISETLMFDATDVEHRVTYGSNTQVAVTKEPGNENLKATTVYIEMPESVMVIMQYFTWESGHPFWQDGIQISGENQAKDWQILGSGLFYSKNETAYTADFPRLICEDRTQTGFFGQSSYTQIIGALSFPFGSTKQGGYVLYRYKFTYDDDVFLTCSLLNYAHLQSPLHLPYINTEERMLSGALFFSDAKQQHYTTYDSLAYKEKDWD